MRRILLLSLSLMCLLSACNKATTVATQPFDLTEATTLVEPIDRVFFDAMQKQELTDEEYTQSLDTLRQLSITYPDMPGSDTILFEVMFDWDVEGHIVENIYPTVFHQSFEIADAYICIPENPNDRTELVIILESSDEHFSDFSREYIFHQDESKEWKLYECKGVAMYDISEKYPLTLLVPKDEQTAL